MLIQNLSFSKTLYPNLSFFQSPPVNSPKPKSRKTICLSFKTQKNPCFFSRQNASLFLSLRCFAGRSKGKPGGQSSGRLEGNSEFRRRLKQNARNKSKKYAESLFYRLKNPNKNYPDNFTEDELQQIGLGYDRMVRFMEKDDPNLRHPHDWYKYGEFGPYSWRGIVLGDPIRGEFSDERVTLISQVKNHEEWDEIEQHDMNIECNEQLSKMNKSVGFRYYWVFVRHPKWRLNELPWQQWTLVSEVTLEAGKQRIDKWSLMGRLGNIARRKITQCAAWMRPDIVYVKRPVYQCRFEPQDDFFRALTPYLDPTTEQEFLFEVTNEDGSVDTCTYFGGLCKIVKVSPKAFVDDVVKAYDKLSEDRKLDCLTFLLENHPVPLLHPYTKEWKAKLDEMELGCDAPESDDEEENNSDGDENVITDWMEIEEKSDEDEGDDVILEEDGENENEDEVLGNEDENSDEEEDEEYWQKEFEKAVSKADEMELLARRSVERNTKMYKKQLREMQSNQKTEEGDFDDGDETELRGKRAKVRPEEWKIAGLGRWNRRIRKSRIPPGVFLRAAVRPFTYKNLVKEIVLTRHAILDGEIGQ